MNCSDCRWARVRCKIYSGGRIQTSKDHLVIFCMKGVWVDQFGRDRIFKTLGPVVNSNSSTKVFYDRCSHFEESWVPWGTWKGV